MTNIVLSNKKGGSYEKDIYSISTANIFWIYIGDNSFKQSSSGKNPQVAHQLMAKELLPLL